VARYTKVRLWFAGDVTGVTRQLRSRGLNGRFDRCRDAGCVYQAKRQGWTGVPFVWRLAVRALSSC
jgi:hypothetical protein